ncbi:MucR family transcriptional regulator [Labrys miyagiensis]
MDDAKSVAVAAEIVAAYVSNNSVSAASLPTLIGDVHLALQRLKSGESAPAEAEQPKLMPAVPIKKSVTPDFIICLEDGKKFKSLKRHLSSTYDMTPDDYRAKWGLPNDYPMVAPNYAAQRSSLARSMGLGSKGRGRK